MKAQIYDLIYIFIEQKTLKDSSYSQIIRVQRNHTPNIPLWTCSFRYKI